MEKYICIHGHFYQPPRENPWLESIELQDSAYPYHDWNERITAECYGPNGTSRILDDDKRIVKIMNNYSLINFNFGPTLLSWMEENAPHAYRAIFEADQLSVKRFSGHGSAIAQVYNHMIMPLANARDKFTQVFWGIRDFEFRFGRKPEGMWLAETAVDLESLEILADLGITYTILAPHQAKRVRKIGDNQWDDVSNASIDPKNPYKLNFSSGKSIALFFYDGPISRSVAFERLLEKGEYLVDRLMTGFSENGNGQQLVHIATDGETYGHHHRFGDMALAFALNQIESRGVAKLTNYGEFLAKFPPAFEVEIFENTSWSCVHGVERWRSNCGCNMGGRPEWNQVWRKPLREALDWLRDTTVPLFEKKAGELMKDPWMARNDYIELLFDRSSEEVDDFFGRHATRDLSAAEKIQGLKLLEMQRQAMLMYTSCGWFFDEISGIEAVQVLQYAARALQLAEELFGESLETEFLRRLEFAPSNIPDLKNGRVVYNRYVKPSAMDLAKVGAHYAISSLFSNGIDETKTYCYTIDYEEFKNFVAGKARLVLGVINVTSEVTKESDRFDFAILHLGDHNLNGGVIRHDGADAFNKMSESIVAAFKRADFGETIRIMDKYFGGSTYSLKTLFRDEQRKIVSSILETTLADSEAVLRQIYENNAPLMRFLADMAAPLPKALQAAAEFTINMSLKHALESDELDVEKISALLVEAKEARVPLDAPGLAYVLQNNLLRLVDQLWADPDDGALVTQLDELVGVVLSLPFDVNLWSVQNNYYEFLQRIFPNVQAGAEKGDESYSDWLKAFRSLGEKLKVKVV